MAISLDTVAEWLAAQTISLPVGPHVTRKMRVLLQVRLNKPSRTAKYSIKLRVFLCQILPSIKPTIMQKIL